MTRCRLARLAAAVAFAVAAPAAVTAEPLELKAFIAPPPTAAMANTYDRAFKRWVEKVNGATAGQLRLVPVDDIDAPPNKAAAVLGRGGVDVLHSPARYYLGAVPEADALVACNRSVEEVRANGGLDLLNEIWHERLNAHILAWFESNITYSIYLTRRPSIAEGRLHLGGLTIRANATLRDFFSALGADLTATSASQIAAKLEKGVLQGFGFPTIAVSGLGVLGHVKYRLEPSFYRGNNLLLVNLDTWQRLPVRLRGTLAQFAIDAEGYSRDFIAATADREARAQAAAGVESIVLDGAARRDFLARANDIVWERLAERAPEKVDSLKEKFYAR
ncbi:MAG: hypothetical protein AB7K86_21690 [Rhodospirillales bacterium]